MAVRTRLTEKAVAELAPDPDKVAKGTDTFAWDTTLSGFGVKLSPAGGRSYIYQYRDSAGRTKRLTLGSVEKLNASAARDLAEKARTATRAGRDPQAEKIAARKAQTIREHAEEWVALLRSRAKRGEVSPRTVDEYASKVKLHLTPAFGTTKPADLTTTAIRAWRDKMLARHADADEDERAMGPEGVKGCLRVLSALCGHLVERGELAANPAKGLGQFVTARRQRYMTTDEASRLGAEVEKLRARAPHWAAAIELLLYTGMRKVEVLSLRWDAVREDEAAIVLRDHKTARKTGEKRIQVTDAVREVLARAAAWRRPGCPYVFPSVADRSVAVVKGGKPPSLAELRQHMSAGGLKRQWLALRKAAHLTGDDPLRVHDLRHSYASAAVSNGVPLALVGRNLGHRSAATTARYAHIHDEAAAKAAAQVSTLLKESLARRPAEASITALPLPEGARHPASRQARTGGRGSQPNTGKTRKVVPIGR